MDLPTRMAGEPGLHLGMLGRGVSLIDRLGAESRQESGNPAYFETCTRLAFKAQSRCRATNETLAEIKNPPSVAFVPQANIAAGHQQVNNGVQASGVREIESQQTKPLGTA